ncbi:MULTISPECIES: menaquinol-cytochrome c reductase cytochrome b/c subunit [Paenibacillus]|uniref:C-type cytochrome n=1 Tax=Paenibacillus campinasensis TaxID=66347 RepID=A0A268F2X6_9BACL|nr:MULTISPECIES: menaquinol-cytochrome c reductase cytochrome b/c subunit [Paenibacillus]MUG65027.1 c-type cytochrome [Paenibacillus campinasensis]PAD79738.1 menaquinol-cytochrome C reductase [Paenibacillus campinasensis]PAK53602.1 menaquinol-cytochrome C reductase [Paenibacillus sp. 7541]
MAHGHKSDEKVVYVGDSRVKKGNGWVVPPDYTAYPGKSEAFIPNFLLKEWMVGVVVLVGFLVLTISEPAPLGYPADPGATVIPMPDWYFLFLYEYLKLPYASGDYVVLGTIGVTGIAFGALLLVPFLDTGKERRFYKRPITSSLMILSLLAIVYLTNSAWTHYVHELEASGQKPEHIQREEEAHERHAAGLPTSNAKQPQEQEVAIVDPDNPAMEIYKKATCINCHAADLKGQGAPSLRGVGDTHSKEEILAIIHNGQGNMPPMTQAAEAAGVTEEQLDQLAEWLASQKSNTE